MSLLYPDVLCALAGFAVGAVGAAPLLIAYLLAARSHMRAGIGFGMIAVAVSAALLFGAGAFMLMKVPYYFLTCATGMVVGYFAMLALMTALAIRCP